MPNLERVINRRDILD